MRWGLIPAAKLARRSSDRSPTSKFDPARANTTIAVVATDAALTKAEAQRLAIMAADGMARAIRPDPHALRRRYRLRAGDRQTPMPRGSRARLTALGSLAADGLARAIGRALWAAESIGRWQSSRAGLPK